MAVKVEVPKLGEAITEVQLGSWLVQPGAWVEADTPLVELESDKATVEVPAPAAGRLTEILKQSGESAKVGETLAIIDETAVRGDGAVVAAGPKAAPLPKTVSAPPAPPVAAASAGQVTPAKRDEAAPVATAPAPAPLRQVVPDDRPERVVPMTPIRRRIAERLVQSQRDAALLTTFNEIDMTRVMELRRENQEAFQARFGVKLGFMSFFTKAVVESLREIPVLNAEVRGQDIVHKDYFDIGIAVGGGKGLVVPVLRDADRMGFGEIEQRIADFAARALAKKLDLSELSGGTFTISNGGIYGSLLGTPIINPPQSGVLGMHAIQKRAVVRDNGRGGDEIVIRPMMYVALTYDHRIVDGREAAGFLMHVKRCIEHPERLMLQI